MGHWPKSVKRRRHNWVTNLGRKLVLLGCTGYHEIMWPNRPKLRATVYVLECPMNGEHGVVVQARSEDAATIKGARKMGIA